MKTQRSFLLRVFPALVTLLALTNSISHAQTYEVERLNEGEPIISEEMFEQVGATEREGQNINGATLVKLPAWLPPERRADPSAQYYLYFAHHGGRYIRMAWAASPAGPFTLYRVGAGVPVGSRGVLDMGEGRLVKAADSYRFKGHIASPEVLIDDENQRFVMYFHGVGEGGVAGQYSMPAVSPDGLDFNGGLQPCAAGTSYFRIFHVNGQAYAFANGCRLFRAPAGTKATDDRAMNPPDDFPTGYYWKELPDFREKIEGEWAEKLLVGHGPGQIRHCAILPVGENRFHLFYSVKKDHPPERILMTKFDATDPDWRKWTLSAAEEILRPERAWEGVNEPVENSRKGGGTGLHQLRDPYVFRDLDGTLYLYYSGSGEEAIGVAKLSSSRDHLLNP